MPPVTAPDVDDARLRRQLQQLAQTARLPSHLIRRGRQSPALRVAALEVLASPIGYRHVIDAISPVPHHVNAGVDTVRDRRSFGQTNGTRATPFARQVSSAPKP